jgi:hypothetical protein
MPKFLKWATVFLFALSVLVACGGGPEASGETLSFEVGDTKAVTNDDVVLFLTRTEDGWTCEQNGVEGQVDLCVQDVAGEVMFFFQTDKIGVEDLQEAGTLILYGEWEYIGKGG